jgi:hypothetical protein
MRYAILAALCCFLVACDDDPKAKPVEELMKPETCKTCHEEHFNQWAGSMHAYASDDPVFVAMNKRGQRDTNGALGDFCVNCHAPMALAIRGPGVGATFDPATLLPEEKGVTCYFCHNVKEVTATHDNGLVLAMDQTMRGGVRDPVVSPAHFSEYDALMDSDKNESEICGACHDIVVPQSLNGVAGGVAIERTFNEWQQTFFATDTTPGIHFSCGSCHMQSDPNPHVIADGKDLSVPARKFAFHEHLMPGIDQALTMFPGLAEQEAAIKRDLEPAIRVIGPFNAIRGDQPGGICLEPDGKLKIRIDTLGPGHAWPSGASHDRRAWLEVIAKDATGAIVFTSGLVPEGTDPPDDLAAGLVDPQPFGLWDRTFKANGMPAHFFYEIAEVRSQLMKLPTVRGEDHSYNLVWNLPIATANQIDRIETRLLIRPLPFEVLADLEASGDLAPTIRNQLRLLEVGGGRSIWTKATRGTGPAENTFCNPQ